MKLHVKHQADKEDLLAIASGRPVTGVRSASELPVKVGGMSLVWSGVSRETLPNWIVVPDDDTRSDLLAWVTTYLPAHVPFTALCRVVTGDELVSAESSPLSVRMLQVCAALVLTEAFMISGGPASTRDGASTYSYVAARSLAVDVSRATFARVTAYYERALAAVQDIVRFDVFRVFVHTWDAVASCRDNAGRSALHPVHAAVDQLLARSFLDVDVLRELSPTTIGVEVVSRFDRMTMEDRVLAFRRMASGFSVNEDETGMAFVLGYVLSRVSGGTLSAHLRLLDSLQGKPAFVVPWYALCSAAHPNGKIEGAADAAIGMRMIREIERSSDWGSRPRCDLALPEFDVLQRSHDFRADGALRGLRTVSVELSPGIETRLSVPGSGTSDRHPTRQLEFAGLDPQVAESDAALRLRHHLQMALAASEELLDGGKRPTRRRPRRD